MDGEVPGMKKESLGQAAASWGKAGLGLLKRGATEVTSQLKRSVDPNIQLKRLLHQRYLKLKESGQSHNEALESVAAGTKVALNEYIKELRGVNVVDVTATAKREVQSEDDESPQASD